MNVPIEGRPMAEIDAGDVLEGIDGNAFIVMGVTQKALKRAGATGSYVAAYLAEAMSSDYDHLLVASMAFLEPEGHVTERMVDL